MHAVTKEALQAAGIAFTIPGAFLGAELYGSGHINDTYLAKYKTGQETTAYILQRINTDVFKNADELMANIAAVTAFIGKKVQEAHGDVKRECLNLVHTKDNKPYFTDMDGGCWRAYIFVDDTTTFQQATPKSFYESARAFGRFAMLLSEFPAETLHETIVNFHNTPERMRQFQGALGADVKGRAALCQEEINFVLARVDSVSRLTDLQAAGKLPLRVTHNDTKLNNVLIDNSTEKGLCVVDLDTVMPGLLLYDFGDSIRFGASTAAEDEQNLELVNFSIDLFRDYTRGYMEVAKQALTPGEIENLHEGARMMTLECGIRFLTDHLAGDTYFKIHRENHNLDRARTQFRLVAQMEEHFDEMQSIVKELAQ